MKPMHPTIKKFINRLKVNYPESKHFDAEGERVRVWPDYAFDSDVHGGQFFRICGISTLAGLMGLRFVRIGWEDDYDPIIRYVEYEVRENG